jgi:4-hydroxy-tetrahydrodipicolinate synthase
MAVLAGNDDVFLRCLQSGGVGGILVASHVVGNEMREIFDAMQAGDAERAAEIEAAIRPIYEATALDTNPIPIKAAAEMLGMIPSARMRLPMVEADAEVRAGVRAALEAHGLLTASTA